MRTRVRPTCHGRDVNSANNGQRPCTPLSACASPAPRTQAAADHRPVGRPRREHLARAGQRGDTRGDVDRHSADVVAHPLALARVQAAAHRDPDRLRRADDRLGAAQARLGLPSNAIRKPSPIVLTSRPPKRSISRRTAASCAASRSRQRVSPSSAARSVPPQMSVNTTVSSSRSLLPRRPPVRNSSISPTNASVSPSVGRLSSPSSQTSFAPGIRSAR